MDLLKELDEQIGKFVHEHSKRWEEINKLRSELSKQLELLQNGEEYDTNYSMSLMMQLMLKLIDQLNPNTLRWKE